MPTALAERKNGKFTEYNEIMNEFFIKNQIVIRPLPDWVIQEVEKRNARIEITSAKQYVDYLNQELTFWNTKDPGNIFDVFSDKSALRSALNYFNKAKEYSDDTSYQGNVFNMLRQSTNAIIGKCLNSKTTLAKYLTTKCSGKTKSFIDGFKAGVSKVSVNFYSNYSDVLEGFYSALVFKKSFIDIYKFNEDDVYELEKNISDANTAYSELNSRYTNSFEQHEQMILNLREKTETNILEMNTQIEEYFKNRDKRCAELEKLYTEKLMLEAPATYWSEMDKEYTKKGRIWLFVSVASTVLLLAGLLLVIIFVPSLFSNASHWFDIIRNSAIITVVTSVAVYMIRHFFKLSTSAFHLSRDAKERCKLTNFYLSLIENGSVTDKERAIVLNSLFSRADTGLLKGDSTPSMSANITDLVQSLTSNK